MSWASFRQTKRFRIVLAVFVLIVILAVAIPLIAYFVSKNKNGTPKSNVLVPLYVYPNSGAWDPLMDVIEEYPDVRFDVVVNPANGPGDSALPDGNYTEAIPLLTAHDNVRVLGYVHTTWAERNLSAVLSDVDTYAAWSTKPAHPGLGVKGIFVDEAPSKFDAQAVEYLETLTEVIKDASGLGSDPYVVHNPGNIPAEQYMASADCTVVFEETYETYVSHSSAKLLSAMPDDRKKKCVVMHSIPPSISEKDFKDLVHDVRDIAGGIYMTDLSVDYYSNFSDRLDEFVTNMD